MTQDVFADVIGQPEAVAVLRTAVAAAHGDPSVPPAAMTHAWLFTGPPGSGRSVAARAFAAALECPDRGCGHCVHCRTAMAGTHADVRTVTPEGLTIAVREMRAVVQLAARRPVTGPWQIVLIEDADRLSEAASNALLKAVEEPPSHTVFLLCAPSTHPDDVSVTIRSRCRVLSLRIPPPSAIAEVLVRRDGIDPDTADWAASVAGGHVGRARRLATDQDARAERERILSAPADLRSFGAVFGHAAELLADAKAQAKAVSERRDSAELEELRTALGAGGTGRGAVGAARGSAGVVRDLERRQKSRATRTERDALDRALVDLSGFYRDVIAVAFGARQSLTNPDVLPELEVAAGRFGAEGALRRLDAVLECRLAIEQNVKPQIAVEALMVRLWRG
ncbi:DNA polymerase III subunit delta' [Nakamurella endophytica]|uniref:DNA polymerase III subunit delta' n=1 Tax=Nakamurella endophytica TaxID=1748367 RepID=A0A917SZX4_9ACTN|nr:DNA polymerase III subunit delta' [Nakamurella endophytica]GGM05269.1 DNA polymerase III subunit delta' [Nakamurella endophytica]